MNNDSLVLQVAVPSPLRRSFDYLPPADCTDQPAGFWQPGMRLRVPFGSRKLVGFVSGTSTGSKLDRKLLKRAHAVLDTEPVFSQALLRSLNWAAGYYQSSLGEVLAAALPVRLRQGASGEPVATRVWIATAMADPTDSTLARSPRQKALLARLQQSGAMTSQDCSDAGFDTSLLAKLRDKGLAMEIEQPATVTGRTLARQAPLNPLTPNPEQTAAIDVIKSSLGGFQCHLLDGVTGSGKTEVYLQVIGEVLARGRQALVLVPEIGLTPQTIARFRDRFSCSVVALHSGLTDRERLEGWYQARAGQAGIVIGTRSAVFSPLARPGLIVIDEEHDGSFKQQDGFRYSARDLAVVRAREEGIPVVLGSATPALESLHNARAGRYTHLVLSQRAGDAARPPMGLLDTSQGDTVEGFGAPLLASLDHHLRGGNQVLVFINRRGFAPSLTCQECGQVFECERCDAQLTVHRAPPGLQCHHCETRRQLPRACVACGSRHLMTRGMGTEKTEQFLIQRFNGTPVIRIDRDSTRRKHALNERLQQVQQGEPCILVGTQMLAKGHHFPAVTLVAVLDADSGLFSPDFRGQEHMVQLLFQVAGRAGRAGNPGQVIIQTRHAGHPLLAALTRNDYHLIADLLLDERRRAGMPPFGHLALVRAESTTMGAALELLQFVYEQAMSSSNNGQIRSSNRLHIHHPLPAPMEKRAGRFRAQLLIRAAARGALQPLVGNLATLLQNRKSSRRVRWSIDVDPQDLT